MDTPPNISPVGMQAIQAAFARRAQGQTAPMTSQVSQPQAPMPSGMPNTPMTPTPQIAPPTASQVPQQNLTKAPVNNMQADPTQDNANKSLKQAVNLLGTPRIDPETKTITKALIQKLLQYH